MGVSRSCGYCGGEVPTPLNVYAELSSKLFCIWNELATRHRYPSIQQNLVLRVSVILQKIFFEIINDSCNIRKQLNIDNVFVLNKGLLELQKVYKFLF